MKVFSFMVLLKYIISFQNEMSKYYSNKRDIPIIS